MYTLVTLGPLRMSTYGLCLLAAAFIWWTWSERALIKNNLPPADWVLPGVIVAAWLGGRLGVILLQTTSLLDAVAQLSTVRVFEFQWWSAIGVALIMLWRVLPQSFSGSLTHMLVPLLVAYGMATLGATIGGTAVGTPTALPWGIESYGNIRHPVGLYAALIVWSGALWVARRQRAGAPIGWATIGVFAAQELVCGGFRLNGWVIGGGLHVTQLVGLVTLIVARERVIMTHHRET